jgi:hypothetical protein
LKNNSKLKCTLHHAGVCMVSGHASPAVASKPS